MSYQGFGGGREAPAFGLASQAAPPNAEVFLLPRVRGLAGGTWAATDARPRSGPADRRNWSAGPISLVRLCPPSPDR